MKISMKRVAALLLALVMVIGLLPVMNNVVDAVDVSGSLTDKSVGLSYATDGSPNANTSGWSANGNAITGNLQGVKKAAVYMNATSTLTITNNKSAAANLSFDYSTTTLNSGSATIDGQTATSGSFSKKLAAGESVEIVLSVSRTTGNKDNAMSISITNLILASASNTAVTTTFEAPAFGSYTVAYGDQTLTVAAGTSSQTASNLPSVSYTFTANPGTGYKMVGWYNVTTDKYLGTNLTYTGSFEEACTVKAVVVPNDTAVFMTGSNYYADLNDAVAYAQSKGLNQITLVQGGILPAGEYTIPAGITLLIPMDNEYTVTRTDDPDFVVAPEYTTEYTAPYAYLTLTMADGASLIVNGTLDVESKHTTLQGSKNTGGRPCGAYGAIYMNPNADITVNNGANLYAWGYIYGEGNVVAESGSKVYEIMQVTDFPGGSNMSQFVDTDPTYDVDGDGNPSNDYFKTFPFSQYYVQNIEVALTLKAGAAEYVYLTMTAGGQSMGLPVRFIGEGGMFVPGEGGTIVKDYDPSTDRLNVTVNGNASMAGIALDLGGTKYEGAVEDVLGTSKVDSASFILTLNSNITININSGITTVKQDLSLLPGVEINIAEEATLVVAERTYADGEYDNLTVYGTYTGYNIYVWDLDNWGKFVFSHKYLSALTYSPTSGRYTRTYDDLKDVTIDINGTVICEGYIYSTVNFDDELWVPVEGAGAAVISTGKTGTLVLQNGPGPEDMAYCLDGSSSCDSAVFVDSVWLLNGDGSYVLTEGCEPGTTYGYCDVHDLWYTEGHGNCIVINTFEVTWIVNGVGAPEEYLLGDVPSYKGGVPTKPANGCVSYTFAGWATSANGAVLTELPAVTGDAVYFAVFSESTVHVGDNNQDHNCDGNCGEKLSSCVDANQNHKCDYTGCQAVLTACEDADENHFCDYIECQKYMSNCVDNDQDHYCDFASCGGMLTVCDDVDLDHKCDYTGCNKVMSTCIDTDKDHYCDYTGCNDKISICADTNYDHKCDYVGCQETISSCIDANNDHKCDYAGCKVNITACKDLNQDHKCDYAGCQAVLTACEDANEDHFCDYVGCQECMSDCVDNNQDHYCDFEGCGIQNSSCADRNNDHKCDYTGCNKVLSTCRDNDNNHYCDYQTNCGKKLSDCEDKDQDHKCDYTGCKKTLSSCEDKNYDHQCDFAKCDNVLSSCVDNNADHKCDFAGCQATMTECRDDNLDHYCDYQTNCGKKLSNCVDSDENHYCDYAGCQDLLSDCEDNDFNHQCDFAGCNEITSICEDIDEDHFCDYVGCGLRLTYCEDANFNHYCDYVGCEDILSNCEDADEDHCCDYEGCGNVLSTCEDLNNNHYCDYAGCGEELSTCVDANNDHKCDYNGCKAKLSNCIDANRDHYCDYEGCNVKLSGCIDINYDHLCDYVGCGDVLTQCRDFDEDHFCDYYNCLAEMSVCEDADNDHYCDYEGCQCVLSDHNWVAAGCLTNGYCDICGGAGEPAKGHGFSEGWEYIEDSEVHNVICKDCYDYSYTEAHSYDENHNCVCGSVEFYTITFMDGNKVHTTYGAPYGLPANFYGMPIPQAPSGYEWAGWYTADGIRVNPGTVWDRDVVCYATWSKIVYTVNWIVDGSSTQETYEYGAKINFVAPSKTGYTFTGWMIDGEIYQTTDSYIVTGAVTATATWQINSYKITFRVNGIVSNVETVVYGTQITQHWLLSKGLCDLNGYSLLGWTVTYSIKQNPNNYNFTMPAQDFYADAILAINTYTVTWIVDGTSINETYNYGDTPAFKGSTDKANDGCAAYVFTGWDKELVTVTGNMTYIAQYEQVEDHVGFPLLESNKDGKTHNVCCSACHEVVYANVDHSADEDTGRCGCGVIQVSIIGDDCIFSDAFVPTDRGFCVYVEPDTDFSANLTYIAGSRYTMIVASENPMIKTGTNKLTITKEEAAEIADNGYRVMLNACWRVEIRLNGGAITEQYKAMLDAFGYAYSEDALDMMAPVYGNLDLVSITPAFVREGYTLIGFQDEEGNFYSVAEEELYFETDKDTYLVAIWQCDHNWDDATCTAPKTCSVCGDIEGEALGHGHTQGWAYVAGTQEHEVICKDCCGYSYTEAHSYVDGVCVCEAVDSYTLTVYAMDGSVLLSTNVPYGVNVYNYVKDLVGGSVPVNVENQIGELVFTGWMDINANPIVDGYTMPAEDLEVVSNFAFTGWMKYGYIDGWVYESLDQIQKTGWTEIDGSWYYLDTETGIRAEGLTRVSYPTAPINGITYAPNMEDVIYANNKGILFLDATTGLFLFDENGKFLPGYTGLVGDSYAVNGYLVWHYGLVEINGNYYYFIGDVNNGGNVMVKGCDYNVGRNTATNRSFVIGGLYTFGADGAMCMYEGITNVNGVLRYYEDAQLMLGKGLTQVEENFIYVNAYGSLVVDAEYYIGANDKGVDKGIYYFDADGFIVIPEAEPGKSGLFFEEGKWFYYVDGAKAYCAGLIEIDGNLVYVKSDGSLATGVYYVTNTNGHAVIASGTKCTFDDNGILVDPFIGVQVLEEGSIRDDFDYRTDIKLNANGKLTIDVFNIWMDSDVDCVGFNVDIYALNGDYYGEIVRGEGTVEFDLPAGEYTVILYVAWFDDADEDLLGHGKGNLDYKITFTSDGTPLNGIVDGYYYVDGHIGYAAGLIVIDGILYYVRSNGQIVTDCQYWITNVNDTGYEPGLYEFDCDGWMYEIYVETFTGIKDGYFYIEDEVAYAAGLKQYNGGYVYVRSNGQIATGKYWITNHNGLLPEGFYDFGENGIYYPAIPENAQLLMEVNKNVDTDGFWDYNAIANAVRASADGHIYIEVTDVTFEDELYGQGGFCIAFDGSYWVYQWDEVYKVGTGVVMIPVPADENVVLFVNPADINDEGFDWAYGTISYKIWSDVDCELVQGSTGE